jgi:hypothetical protein
MPLVDTTTLLAVADRAAYQYEQIDLTFTAIQAQGNGYYFEIVTQTEDPDVEIPTEQDYHAVDEDLEPSRAAKTGSLLCSIIGGMEAHFNVRDSSGAPLQVGGWDGYLYSEDVRVSQYFGELFFACKGKYMLAVNVFSEGDDQFAQAVVAGGPSITFTDGINYGNGDPLNPANGTYFAATQLKVKVTSMGGTAVDLRLSVKDVNDNPTTIDVSIPASQPPGTEIDVGGTSDRFLDVTGIGFVPAGSTGTLGDTFTIRNKKERQIAL